MSLRRQARGPRVTHRASAADGELVELRVLAREARIRIESASRFVALGLLEPSGGTHRDPLFTREAASMLAAAERLRRDLDLNYAGAVLAYELLARIEELEARLERLQPPEQRPDESGPWP